MPQQFVLSYSFIAPDLLYPIIIPMFATQAVRSDPPSPVTILERAPVIIVSMHVKWHTNIIYQLRGLK